MTFWSGEKLLQNKSVVDNFDENRVDANAYNLSMGNCYFRTTDGNNPSPTSVLKESESVFIPPGQFAFLLSKETVNVPRGAMAFISMRTGIKFQGLINVSGFHVDPGYSGKLIYAVFNASPSPVQITEGAAIFKIWFSDLDQISSEKFSFSGKAQNTIGNELVKGMSREIYSLQSLSDKIRDLDHRIQKEMLQQKPTIDNLMFVWRAIVLGVVGALIIGFLTLTLPTLSGTGIWIYARIQPYLDGATQVHEIGGPPKQ
ncbi:MAG: deoxycytidine triphosphate deaminase [Pseudomonadota bacterium]